MGREMIGTEKGRERDAWKRKEDIEEGQRYEEEKEGGRMAGTPNLG